ncbi:MAG TPA: bstEII [Anaerolineae bacterium]|nr:bstEII [Anaerolineae bacterium]HQI86842.1 bstEII [Anaerolineae bacterium]
MEKTFADYWHGAENWITLTSGEYYPDILEDACNLYMPVLEVFGQLLGTSYSSQNLFEQISDYGNPWMRVQLCRVFHRYVSPDAPVEMTKIRTRKQQVLDTFGQEFRAIHEVQAKFNERPKRDEALCALLWEYKSRGQKGYTLTEKFFDLFQSRFPTLKIVGPKRAGQDIALGSVFDEYPNPARPVDFVVYGKNKQDVLVVGLARYDSDRGGAQEDDRTGGYKNCADEVLNYVQVRGLRTKMIFLNDGPGLLLGSMWRDYVTLEESWPGKIKVVTLRMVTERVTYEWLTA